MKPPMTVSSIALNEDPTTLIPPTPTTYGSDVTFTTTVEKLKGGEYPMVYLAAYDGDGIVIYGQLDHPDTVFVLGGGSSKWKNEGLGGADCKAFLYAYGGKNRGIDTIRELCPPIEFRVG